MKNAPPIYNDAQTRHLYANDASMYEERPKGVAFPKNRTEIRALVKKAARENFSLTLRSAGTSLAGQTTSDGVVVDVSRHMDDLTDINPKQKTADVQPGVIRDALNRRTAPYNLEFGPDTATTDRCMLGGMIGNNSCGLFSIKHNTTREHILEIEAVLSNGSTALFKPLTQAELEQKKQLNNLEGYIYRGILQLIERNREQILQAYPHPGIIRRNTGYALDRLCEMQPFNPNGRPFNMAELLCGSEGTLAVTSSAKIKLVDKSPNRIVLAPHFDSVNAAMDATVEAVKHEPAAVELVDDIILDATKENLEQRKYRFFLKGEPKCILIIQFEGEDQNTIERKAEKLKQKLLRQNLSTAVPVISDEKKMQQAWALRKAGLGLLMGLGSDERSPSFCEDTAVRVSDLPAYVKEFQQLLKKYNTHCVFYGHASVGELHLRPVVDFQTETGVQKMKQMAEDVAGLVNRYNGSLSGEHGDGRVRAPYIKKVLGEEMMPLLKKVKEIWDPNYIFNPGKIVNPKPLDDHLRVSPTTVGKNSNINTMFKWRKEDSFTEALDLCNGAGVCRKEAASGGTMCPSYMATKEEKDSTRGRANLFRQLFAGKGPDAFTSEELYDALDLCISCKGCKSECPANVDMARMKAEFMHGRHEEQGISLSERFFGQAAKLYPLGSKINKVTNWLINSNIGKEILCQLFNISKERTLPLFAEETFMEWFENSSSAHWFRGQTNKGHNIRPTSNPDVGRRVALFIDIFTNYHDPQIGKAAVRFLESKGYRVIVPKIHEIGRPQLSKGMLTHAKNTLNQTLPQLTTFVDRDIPILGLEPSEILTLRDEYLDLCDDSQLESAQKVAEDSYTFPEFAAEILDNTNSNQKIENNQKVYVHGHCHAKALIGQSKLEASLSTVGYNPVILDTGCGGMAGSFGYETDHYELSMEMGNQRLFPAVRKAEDDALICAPGFSCRHHIKHGTGRDAYHPAELLAKAM